jgi:hypothetical protein
MYKMKLINRFFICVLAVASPMAGCDTDALHELNVDPQSVEEIDLNYLFSAAELGSAAGGSAGDNRYIDWRTNIGFCAYAIQQLANVTGGIAPGDKYTDNTESYNAPWEFMYGDQLKNTAEILKQTGPGGFDEGEKVNLRNAARILRVFNYHRLTDFYGNIPYTEANRGMGETDGTPGILFPKYDTQQAVYMDLLKELDEASAALSASNPDEGFANADLIYDGDIAKWKKWGYSLMLRLAMRISYVDEATAETYIDKAITGGVFTSNDDNPYVKMALAPSEWTNQNGISRAFYPGDGGQPSFLSKTLIDMLKGTNPNTTADDDPRLMIISGGIANWTASEWDPVNTDPLDQKGMPNGMNQAMINAFEGQAAVDLDATYSKINFLLLQDDEPYQLMNYAEVELLQAEAAERSLGSATDAQAHYEAGVKAAMQMYTPYDASLTVTDGAVATYLATYPYAGTTDEKLEMIGNQLWLSKFLNWWEAWSDWRRTGYPQLVPVDFSGNVTNGTIPVRLRYQNGEVAINPNYASGATLPDDPTTKVWWDVKD